jgi:predicted DNA-binding protein with PD1-like motif
MADKWEMDAVHPNDYNVVEARRGREFIIRLTTGADVFLALQKFAVENNIRFDKIHAAFMCGFQLALFLVWTPNTAEPEN